MQLKYAYNVAELHDISAKFMTKLNKLDFTRQHAYLWFEFCSVLHNYFELAMSSYSSLNLYDLS